MRTLWLAGLLLMSSCSKADKSKDKAVQAAGYCSLIPYNLNDATKGMLDLDEVGANDVEVRGAIKGLNPGSYSIHLHRSAGCPRPAQNADDTENHAADVGTITADAGGIAAFNLTIPNA